MHDFMNRFAIIHRQSEVYLDRAIKEYPLNSTQYVYMLVICENPGISQESICAKLRIDKAPVARSMKELEKGGYIRRQVSKDDKRMYQIYPTQDGKDLYAKISKIDESGEDNMVSALSSKERDQLRLLLDKIIKTLDGKLS